MRHIRTFFLILAAFLAASCSEDSAVTVDNDMLCTVPSDAVAAVAWRRAADMVSTAAPEGDAIRQLSLGRLSGRRAALSLCYTGSLTSILAIELGRNATDSLDYVLALTRQADSLGLGTIVAGSPDGKWKALVISRSEALLAEVMRHVEEGTSILDASGFQDALALATDANVAVLRNSAAMRWLPEDKKGPVRRSCASMVRSLADWTVISGRSGRLDLAFAHPDAPSYYAGILESLAGLPLKVQEAVPDSCGFCFSMATGGDTFRNGYEKWLDAGMTLNKHRNALKHAARTTGKSPLDWEREQGVQEVAIARADGHCVTLIRHSKPRKGCEFAENPFPGFITLLYGRIFAADDPFMCRKGAWTAFGSEEDVRWWADLDCSESRLRPCAFYLKDGQAIFYGDKSGSKCQIK